MTMDEITLKLVAKVNEAKSSISSMIGLTKNLDNSTGKVAQSFDKMSNSTRQSSDNFKDTKSRIQELKTELKSLTDIYNKHSSAFENRLSGTKATFYNPTMGTEKFDPNTVEVITQAKLQEETSKINEIKQKIVDLQNTLKKSTDYNIVPKRIDTKPLDNVKNKAEETNRKLGRTASIFKSLGSIGKNIASIGNKFSGFSKSFNKGVTNNIKQVRKLVLGLIGVRTVMSLLTKSVNAYLSFDSDLQDSLNNSWNMLGSLLAPAIELVAKAFAIATNYVYRFVQALTGIDLVAKANAKAIETQAKKTKALGDAQRGLLGMDEITNLPTESNGSVADQIGIMDIKPDGLFNEIIDAFKVKDWHLAGEIIAKGITKGLRKIKWDVVREGAERMGYNIATFLNGTFEVGWQELGKTIANSINLAIDFAYGFVNEIEWGRLGAGIGDSITTFFETFDFNKLADSITRLTVGIFDMARATLVHLDAEALGNDIAEFLERIDWGKICSSLAKLLVEGTYKALQLNVSIFSKLGTDIRDKFDKKIEKLGSHFGGKFGDGLTKAIRSSLNVIIDAINMMFSTFRLPLIALGKVAGKDIKWDAYQIPHLATGTPNIETEGLYHLHEGEMVVPKRYNPNTNGYNDGSDNKQIIDLLVSLNSSMLEYAERPINISMNGRQVAEASYNDFQEVSRNRNQSTAVTRS